MLAIIGAMEEKVGLLSADMTVATESKRAGITGYQGTFEDVALVLVQCGVG